MKSFKCVFYMMLGAGIAVIYKTYEKEITCMCNKVLQKEKEMLDEGLELE